MLKDEISYNIFKTSGKSNIKQKNKNKKQITIFN